MSIYRFASFSLDTARYELTSEGNAVDLPRLPMDILILLLERDGDLLTRTEIASTIWPGSDPADVVPRINTAINRIRSSLGDDPANPSYVQTVIGRGYRFVATIEGAHQNSDVLPLLSTNAPDSAPQAGPAIQAVFAARVWSVLLPAVLVLLLAAAGGTLVFRHLRHRGTGAENPYVFSRLTSNLNGDRVTAAAISPDGRAVAYADADGVRLKGLTEIGSDAVPTPPLREVDHIAWLPDGTHLIVSGVHIASDVPEVWLLSTAGAAPVLWRSGARQATPAPQGSRMAFTDVTSSAIWVADDLWQKPRRIVQGTPDETFPVLVWAANGKTLLAARHPHDRPAGLYASGQDSSRGTYFAFNTDTGDVTAKVDDIQIDDACLKPDGVLLFNHEQKMVTSLWVVALNAKTGAFLASPRQIQIAPHDTRSLSVSLDGVVASVVRISTPGVSIAEFRRTPPSLDRIEPLTYSTNDTYPHSWTPDGKGVYSEQRQADGLYRIVLQPLGSHDPQALASSPNDQAYPVLTPDGKQLLFIGRNDPSKPFELFRVPAQGGVPTPLLTDGPVGDIRCPQRGTFCVLRRAEDRRPIVFYRLDPNVGLAGVLWTQPQTSDELGGWDISPDAFRLAFTSPGPQQPTLKIVNLASGRVQSQPVSVHSRITALRWASDQKGWFVTTRTVTGSDLFYMDLAGRITLLHQTSNSSWMVPSPDGHKLAFVDQNADNNVWLLRTKPGSPH